MAAEDEATLPPIMSSGDSFEVLDVPHKRQMLDQGTWRDDSLLRVPSDDDCKYLSSTDSSLPLPDDIKGETSNDEAAVGMNEKGDLERGKTEIQPQSDLSPILNFQSQSSVPAEHGAAEDGAAEYDLTEHDLAEHDLAENDLAEHDLAERASAEPSLVFSQRQDSQTNVEEKQETIIESNSSQYKTKIDYRLTKALEDSVVARNLSPELVSLTAGYGKMRRDLRGLVQAAEEYKDATLKMEAARSKLTNRLKALSEDTPIQNHVGRALDAKLDASIKALLNEKEPAKPRWGRFASTRKNDCDSNFKKNVFKAPEKQRVPEYGLEQKERKSDVKGRTRQSHLKHRVGAAVAEWQGLSLSQAFSPRKNESNIGRSRIDDNDAGRIENNGDEGIEIQMSMDEQWEVHDAVRDFESLLEMQEVASAMTKESCEAFQEHVIDYAAEWERIVTTRVKAEIKEVRKRQLNRLHYDKKLEKLRDKVYTAEGKGKEVSAAVVERVERNEEKLQDAWVSHETAAGHLYNLMYEAVVNGWKDLHFVAQNVMELEADRVKREQYVFKNLSRTMDRLDATFKDKDPKTFEALAS